MTVEPIASPPPVLATAILARTQADEDKLANALHRLQEEDPSLVIERNEETQQTVMRGTGETHLQITLEKLARKFGVDVDTEDVRVPYRETITGSAHNAEGKHKKQSGGHGQFGVASSTSSRCPAAKGSSSSTRSSAAPSPAGTSRRCRRASKRRWPPAACTGIPSST